MSLNTAPDRIMVEIESLLIREYGCGWECVPGGLQDELGYLLFEICYCAQSGAQFKETPENGEDPDY